MTRMQSSKHTNKLSMGVSESEVVILARQTGTSFLSNTGNKGQREQDDLENKHENYHLLITSLQNSDLSPG